MIRKDDLKASSLTRIPKGHIIGFFDQDGRLIHCMVSTGNGKAVGVKNRSAIGIGLDNKWEELSLQTLAFKRGYATVLVRGKKLWVSHKPISEILNRNFHTQQPSKEVFGRRNEVPKGTTQSSVPVKYPNPNDKQKSEDKADAKAEFARELSQYKWSKISATAPDLEYNKHKKEFPEFRNWQQYAAKANDLIRTKKDAKGSYVFSNPNLLVKKYGNFYLFDKKDRILLELDAAKAPVSMRKLASLSAFHQYFKSLVKWDKYQGKKDPVLNAKEKFKEHGANFKFKTWNEYALYAQNLIEDVHEKAKNDPLILVERVNGDLMYFNRHEGIFIAANRNNAIINMLKPEIGIDHYHYFTQSNPQQSGGIDPDFDIIPPSKDVKGENNEYESVEGFSEEEVGSSSQTEPIYDTVQFPDPSTDYRLEGKYKTTDWAKKGNLPPARVLSLEFRKHRMKFDRGMSIQQYLAVAHNFIQNTPPDAEVKKLSNGDRVIYHEDSGLLGIYDSNNFPRTLYKTSSREDFDNF